MLTRTIIIAALLWLAWVLYRKSVTAKPSGSKTETATMRQCAHCGLHLPADETVSGSGAYFCSVAHKDAHESRPQ